MASLPITFSDGGFPATFNMDVPTMVDEFWANTVATISSDNLILGQIGGTMPVTNVGPWLNNGTWYVWSVSTYIPATLKLSNSGFNITFAADTLTNNRTVTFKDEGGTVAMLSDVYTGRGTAVLTGASPVVDWSGHFSFYHSITADATPTFSNSLPGQTILYLAANTGAFTLIFPSNVIWPGGTPPTLTSGAGKIDLFEIQNVAGSLYGHRVGADYHT